MKIRITYVPNGGPRIPGWQAYHPSWGEARGTSTGTLESLMDAIYTGTLDWKNHHIEDEYPEWYLEYRWGD